ncbi:hypothetical protein A2U01_0057501, partial [Trifolium medium]|nr:hypothetical protein [Trifolium medium]
GGVSSSQAGVQTGSSVVRQPPPKRQSEDTVIDMDALEKPFPPPKMLHNPIGRAGAGCCCCDKAAGDGSGLE